MTDERIEKREMNQRPLSFTALRASLCFWECLLSVGQEPTTCRQSNVTMSSRIAFIKTFPELRWVSEHLWHSQINDAMHHPLVIDCWA